jgi:hypothetical protein
MVRISVEEAIELDSKGWIVGSSITSRAGWMQWIHGGKARTQEEIRKSIDEDRIWRDKVYDYMRETGKNWYEAAEEVPRNCLKK